MCRAFVGCSCMAFHDAGRLSGGFPERWAEIEMGSAVPSGLGGFVASHEDSMAVPGGMGGQEDGHGSDDAAPARMGRHGKRPAAPP